PAPVTKALTARANVLNNPHQGQRSAGGPIVNRLQSLSRREREMMDIVYRSGSATAADVLEQLGDPPSYSAVRTTLRILEEKGLLKHEQDGKRYVYKPRLARDKARKGAMDHLV